MKISLHEVKTRKSAISKKTEDIELYPTDVSLVESYYKVKMIQEAMKDSIGNFTSTVSSEILGTP